MKSAGRTSHIFYGWWVVAASFFTLGLAVGLPYYGMAFFYDYFMLPVAEGGFGWSRQAVALGLPLGTLLTLWVGPMLAHRFAPRHLILAGTGLTALVLAGFGRMGGDTLTYWLLWLPYMAGNVLSGPLSHQIILSNWFSRRRGFALSIAYLGISLVGALSVRFVARPLTEALGFRGALQVMGCLLLLTWPVILFIMRGHPSEMGLSPDGHGGAKHSEPRSIPTPLRDILSRGDFWVMLLGSACFAGATGSLNQHLKLILKDSGFASQELLDYTFSQTLFVLLVTSAVGRLMVGGLSDAIPKRRVLTVAFVLLAASLPALYYYQPPATPYLFSVPFGLAMGGDFLLVALMAADRFDASSLARILAILLPVMTVGQTWAPYFIAVLREYHGDYRLPLAVILLLATTGWAALTFLLRPSQREVDGR